MKTLRVPFFLLSGLLLSTLPALATPYASGETNNNGTIQFTLNEPADSMWVIFDNSVSNAVTHPPIQVFTAALDGAGLGYQSNDVLSLVGGSGTPASITVTGVAAGGAISSFNLTGLGGYTGGNLLLPTNPVPVTGGAGSGATFDVTYGLTNGASSFAVASGATSYQIYVKKLGAGVSSQISYDGGFYNQWGTPRGIAVNKNPKIGYLFGRVYAAEASGTSAGKTQGVFAMNSDLTDSPLHLGGQGSPAGFWVAGNSSSPYRLEVGPDNSLYVSDYSATANQGLWRFGPNFDFTNEVFAPGNVGRLSGRAVVTGDPSTGNYTIYTPDSTLADNATNSYGYSNDDGGPGHAGEYNNIFRYKLGTNTIPPGGWTNAPDLAINVGLNGIPTLNMEPAIEPNTGNIYAMFYRLNWADPCLIVTDPTGVNRLFTSLPDALKNVGPDPYVGAYSLDITKDGHYLLIEDVFDDIYITSITNGVPDLSSIYTIPNAPYVANSRGAGLDAADNVYCVSSGQGLLRVFSLGFPSTAVTGNDLTGTNGTFQLLLPPTSAAVAATTPLASQGHGTPTAGVFTITLNTNFLAAPVTVNFTLTGTGTNGVNYISSATNTITFPAGTAPSGNWSQNVTITPTASPVSGPTFTVTLTVKGGPTYQLATPVSATVSIQNTGPQLLSITQVPGPSMYRGLPNDWASFIITRYGDTNAAAYSVNSFTYNGSAVFGSDYTAGVQAPDLATPNGSLANGNSGITMNPGDTQLLVAIGNPVPSPLGGIPVNKTAVVGLAGGTGYSASTNTANITIIDNAHGGEVLLYSNSLTSPLDSTNWTVTFGSTNLGPSTVPPVVIKNYNNDGGYLNAPDNGLTNDFEVSFGYAVANDQVTPSLVMQSNGWTTALKENVNKDPNGNPGAPSGVNAYPQGLDFYGNYALRFSMMLVQSDYAGNGSAENATFGIDHYGTNANWIGGDVKAGVGSGTTNQDGVWCDIGASENASQGVPADFALYTATSFPNAGWYEAASATEQAFADVFRHPFPFTGTAEGTTNIGSPANLTDYTPHNSWVDVELRQYQGTNSLYIDKTLITQAPPFPGGVSMAWLFTNGTVMLGYDDPYGNTGDPAAAVYYSDLRVVELAPAITNQPLSLVVNNGASAAFSAGAIGTGPFTNLWYFGTNVVSSNVVSTATDSTSYSIASAAPADQGNYYLVVRDTAGSITSSIAKLSVTVGPAVTNAPVNITTNWHVNVTFTVGASGTSPTYQWSTNAVALTNGTKYAGTKTSSLTISNVVPADDGAYTVSITNAAGSTSASATLTVIIPPSPSFSSIALAGTNTTVQMDITSTDIYDTTGSFILQTATNVTGPWTNVTASFTTNASGFGVTTPTNGPIRFYRILHK